MALQEKYARLIEAANEKGISNLQVREKDNVLYIDGSTSDATVKDALWDVYNEIDPDFRAGDLILDIDASAAMGSQAKITTESSNLNIRKGPGTDQPILGKAAHHSIVTVLNRTNDQWSLIRTENGIEGYAYSQYLSEV